jgi:muramoyltetrapeptide carboxypeptidase
MNILKPPRLRRGDVIGLIAPASPPMPADRIEAGVRYLERLGYRVKLGRHVRAVHGYLAGTDAQRAEDLNAMLSDPQVHAVFALRGGYGTPRLLPLVDYGTVRRRPKIVAGSSDLTALQLALFRRAGLVTFSGPMVTTDFARDPDPFTEEQFWRMLTSARIAGRLPQPPDSLTAPRHPGSAEGRLLGGNLSLLVSGLGTAFSPSFRQAVLVLEDVGEPPYRLDRMFTQLRNAGILARLAGLVLGQFPRCTPQDRRQPHLTLRQILGQVACWADVPAVAGLAYGHVRRKLTLPLGVRVRLGADRGQLEVLESAVV